MYGLPPDIDLSFLRNKPLLQVCVGQNDLILNFDDSLSLTITAAITVSTSNHKQQFYEDYRPAVSPVVSFLGQSITATASNEDGTLKLTFSNGKSLTLHDDSKQYESYVIKHGERLIVV